MQVKRYNFSREDLTPDVSDAIHKKATEYIQEHPGTTYPDAVLHVLRTQENLAKEYIKKPEPEAPPEMPKTYTEAESTLTNQAYDLALATGLDFAICFKRVIAHPKNAGAARRYIEGEKKSRSY